MKWKKDHKGKNNSHNNMLGSHGNNNSPVSSTMMMKGNGLDGGYRTKILHHNLHGGLHPGAGIYQQHRGNNSCSLNNASLFANNNRNLSAFMAAGGGGCYGGTDMGGYDPHQGHGGSLLSPLNHNHSHHLLSPHQRAFNPPFLPLSPPAPPGILNAYHLNHQSLAPYPSPSSHSMQHLMEG